MILFKQRRSSLAELILLSRLHFIAQLSEKGCGSFPLVPLQLESLLLNRTTCPTGCLELRQKIVKMSPFIEQSPNCGDLLLPFAVFQLEPGGLLLRWGAVLRLGRTLAFGFQLIAALATRRTVERGSFEKSHSGLPEIAGSYRHQRSSMAR
jgi:hypothetical protein